MKKPFRIFENDTKGQFVRGARLAKAILAEATYNQLENGTKQIRDDAEARASAARVTGMEIHAFKPSNAVDFRGNVQGKTNTYQSIIMFKGVQYQESDEANNLTFTAVDGNNYHISPINLAQNNCQVRCTCPDFRWTFSTQLQNKDSLYGEGPPLYQKKDPERAPRNPQNVPGVCKHIMAFANELVSLGVLNATGDVSTKQEQPQRQEPEQQQPNDQQVDRAEVNEPEMDNAEQPEQTARNI